MKPEEAKEVVQEFIGDAHRRMQNNMDFALRQIAKLPWWKSWQAQQIAEECLGIGQYWSQGFERDCSPKTKRAYYWGRFMRWLGT